MSIIHEALKKAERDREPRPQGFPLYGGGVQPVEGGVPALPPAC